MVSETLCIWTYSSTCVMMATTTTTPEKEVGLSHDNRCLCCATPNPSFRLRASSSERYRWVTSGSLVWYTSSTTMVNSALYATTMSPIRTRVAIGHDDLFDSRLEIGLNHVSYPPLLYTRARETYVKVYHQQLQWRRQQQ